MPHLGVDAWGSYDEHGNVAPKPKTEDEQRAANEREQVQQVFGLTGGELEDVAWVPTYPRTVTDYVVDVGYVERVEATPFTFPYWYQEVPEYVEREFDVMPTYRTVCEQELYGMAPERVTDDEGTWMVVARYRSSGETECPMRGSSDPNTIEPECPWCEAAPGEPHGYIYIGDGWAEIVYRLEEIERVTSADAGCWVEGWWGQYGVAHLVEKAEAWGYADAEVIDLATRHLATMGPNTANNPELTDDEHDSLSGASDEVETWLNDHVAPEGFYFGWNDGEFFLWSEETWGED